MFKRLKFKILLPIKIISSGEIKIFRFYIKNYEAIITINLSNITADIVLLSLSKARSNYHIRFLFKSYYYDAKNREFVIEPIIDYKKILKEIL